MPPTPAPATLEVPTFKILTRALEVDGSDDRIIRGTASSNVLDHYTTRFTDSAQATMCRTARDNLTIFLNHGYNVPEDVFGSVVDAQVIRRGDFVDLDFAIRVVDADVNPRAEQVLRAIRAGTKLGLSIGAKPLDWRVVKEKVRGKDTEVIEFLDVLLFEASMVGIPGSPRSWVTNALRSITGRMPEPAEPAAHAEEIGLTDTNTDTGTDTDLDIRADADVTETRDMDDAAEADAGMDRGASDMETRGIIAVELAERDFYEDFWSLYWALNTVVCNQMSQEDGDPAAIGAYIRDAVAEFGLLLDGLVAKALAAGVAGPDDDDGTPTSDPDEGGQYAAYSLGDPDVARLGVLSETLTRALTHSHRKHMQAIHNRSARALDMDCASDGDDMDGTTDGSEDGGAGNSNDAQDRALPTDAVLRTEPTEMPDIDLLTRRVDEIQRGLDASNDLLKTTITEIRGLQGRRDAVEAEVKDLEATREALLTQGTGRPTQDTTRAVDTVAPLTHRDMVTLSNEELLERVRAAKATAK